MSLILGSRFLNAFFHQFGSCIIFCLIRQISSFLLVTECRSREFADKFVAVFRILIYCSLSLLQRHHGHRFILRIRQSRADGGFAKCCVKTRKTGYRQLLGVVGVDGRNLTIAVHQTDYLAVLVGKRTTYCIFGSTIREDVIVVRSLELLYAADVLLLVSRLLDRIRNQPDLVASSRFLGCDRGSNCRGVDAEFSHIIEFIGSHDGLNRNRFAGSVNNACLYSSDKWFEGTDSRSLVVDKNTLGRGDNVAFLIESSQGENALSQFLDRTRLGIEGRCSEHQSHHDHIYFFHNLIFVACAY